jgi:hypothetical protein
MEALGGMRQHAVVGDLVGVSSTFIEAEHLPTLDQSRSMVVLVVRLALRGALVVQAGSIPNN